MTSWILVPSLVSLREAFNHECPDRDKASDGAIGNVAHQQESSDHNPDETGRTPSEDSDSINEVHAIDVDDDLRRPGWSMQMCVDAIVAKQLELGDRCPLQNVIYNRRIWSRSWGWTSRAYTGASSHTEHAHFSARYGSGSGSSNPENYDGPWGLEDLMTKTEFMDWMDEFFAVGKQADGSQTSRIGRDALSQGIPPNGVSGEPRMPAYKVIGEAHKDAADALAGLAALEAKIEVLAAKK